jgi:hypothetical protein
MASQTPQASRSTDTYRELYAYHADDEVDPTFKKPPKKHFSINDGNAAWDIHVSHQGYSKPYAVAVSMNGVPELQWDYRKKRAFVDLVNDNQNQAELRGQHAGYMVFFDAIRIHAQAMVKGLGINEDINCFIPAERHHPKTVHTDAPEIAEHRAWVEQRRNAYKHIFISNGYR